MPDFLLEIGTEEIHARMIDGVAGQFTVNIIKLLEDYRLLPPNHTADTDSSAFSTPRRIALLIPSVASIQPDVTEQIDGMSINWRE
jgi:glycyl-tRNA synthetase beta subunit